MIMLLITLYILNKYDSLNKLLKIIKFEKKLQFINLRIP